MTEQERAESFLRRHTGLFFCAACLAYELGLNAFQGRNIMWRLQALPDHEMRGRKCVNCLHGKRCIRHVGGAAILGATAQVVGFLLTNKDIYLCDACLAFSVELGLREVRDVTESVGPLEEFDRREATCTVCSRLTLVTAGVAIDDDPTHDAHQLAEMITGTVQYRDWRLDLLSYKTRAGWRPFVLIKGPADVRVPDAPNLLWCVLPSKVEADRHALTAAKDWIEKHFRE